MGKGLTYGGVGAGSWFGGKAIKDRLSAAKQKLLEAPILKPEELTGSVSSADLATPAYLQDTLQAARDYRERNPGMKFYQDISDKSMNRPVEWGFGNDRLGMESPKALGFDGYYASQPDQIVINRKYNAGNNLSSSAKDRLLEILRHESIHGQQRTPLLDPNSGALEPNSTARDLYSRGVKSLTRDNSAFRNYLAEPIEIEARLAPIKRLIHDMGEDVPTTPEGWYELFEAEPELFDNEMQYVPKKNRDQYFRDVMMPLLPGLVRLNQQGEDKYAEALEKQAVSEAALGLIGAGVGGLGGAVTGALIKPEKDETRWGNALDMGLTGGLIGGTTGGVLGTLLRQRKRQEISDVPDWPRLSDSYEDPVPPDEYRQHLRREENADRVRDDILNKLLGN